MLNKWSYDAIEEQFYSEIGWNLGISFHIEMVAFLPIILFPVIESFNFIVF